MYKKIQQLKRRIVHFSAIQKSQKKLDTANRQLIKNIRAKNLTYLSQKKLLGITLTCQEIEKQQVEGLFLEAGCALGGSSILIAKNKNVGRLLQIYDVFDMIPPPTADDPKEVHERYEIISKGKSMGLGDDKYYGYEDDLLNKVIQNLAQFDIETAKHSVRLIKGLIQETLQINTAVAFAHIDVDWYEPVLVALQRIYPQLSIGGTIILDDYHDWGGCRKATDEFLQRVKGTYQKDDKFGSMRITRIA